MLQQALTNESPSFCTAGGGGSSIHYARNMASFLGRPAQGVSEARAAVRGRQETVWYRVFKRDDSSDVLARAVRSGAAHDGATEEITGYAESDLGRPRSAPM